MKSLMMLILGLGLATTATATEDKPGAIARKAVRNTSQTLLGTNAATSAQISEATKSKVSNALAASSKELRRTGLTLDADEAARLKEAVANAGKYRLNGNPAGYVGYADAPSIKEAVAKAGQKGFVLVDEAGKTFTTSSSKVASLKSILGRGIAGMFSLTSLGSAAGGMAITYLSCHETALDCQSLGKNIGRGFFILHQNTLPARERISQKNILDIQSTWSTTAEHSSNVDLSSDTNPQLIATNGSGNALKKAIQAVKSNGSQ